jgi:hypothetical protein
VSEIGQVLRALKSGLRARREERGSVIVEAAIVVPLLILLTFGAIEFGIGFRDSAAVAGSTRSGARIASAAPAQPAFADNARLSVSDSLKDLLHADPKFLVIYKANSATGNPNGGSASDAYTGCTDCFRYSWNAGTKTWDGPLNSDLWTVDEQKTDVCVGTLPAVGVYVKATQSFITGLFGGAKTFDHKTVMRLEPIDSSTC